MIALRPVTLVLAAATAALPASAQESALDRYVREALQANRELIQQRISVDQAEELWAESRAGYLPSLDLEARYSHAQGGRTFDVPVGDLLNPVYSTLNGLTGSQQFPAIQNQTFDLFRDREQDTRLRVTQVLWNPALRADVRSRRARVDAAMAGTEAARRAVVRDVRIAYYTYANALRAEAILDAALELVQENERSSTVLWQTSVVTRDDVHRARAERLDVEVRRASASTERRLAASFLNYLVARDPDREIELTEADLLLPSVGPLGRLRQAVATPADEAWISELTDQAIARRPELEQLDHGLAAADAGVSAARASTRPSVALALDAGIQGREYGIGPDNRYLMASIVLSWSITAGGAQRAKARHAVLERERIRSVKDDTEARIRLELEAAALRARVALGNLETSAERVREAEEAFGFVTRRREEGLATVLELIDARSALTRALQSQSVGETEALIRLAELDYAAGALEGSPASRTEPETER